MKIIFLLHIAGLLLICSCGSLMANDEVKDFIPGTYIRFSRHEFGTEYDTVVIALQNNSANQYKILRKWKYERILDGSTVEPEYKRLTTSGVYNADHKLLQENNTGDIYSFDIKQKILFNGPVKYQKL
jgi:hypothetical protein